MLSQLSSEQIRVLAERAYPGLDNYGICSRHRDSGHVECTTCYPDLWALIQDHNRLKQRAWKALEDVRAERSHGATANSEYIDRRIEEGLSIK